MSNHPFREVNKFTPTKIDETLFDRFPPRHRTSRESTKGPKNNQRWEKHRNPIVFNNSSLSPSTPSVSMSRWSAIHTREIGSWRTLLGKMINVVTWFLIRHRRFSSPAWCAFLLCRYSVTCSKHFSSYSRRPVLWDETISRRSARPMKCRVHYIRGWITLLKVPNLTFKRNIKILMIMTMTICTHCDCSVCLIIIYLWWRVSGRLRNSDSWNRWCA